MRVNEITYNLDPDHYIIMKHCRFTAYKMALELNIAQALIYPFAYAIYDNHHEWWYVVFNERVSHALILSLGIAVGKTYNRFKKRFESAY